MNLHTVFPCRESKTRSVLQTMANSSEIPELINRPMNRSCLSNRFIHPHNNDELNSSTQEQHEMIGELHPTGNYSES